MNETLDWPNPPAGPKDSILAIGVVSVNYSRLEFALTCMFATITGSSLKFASILVPKISNQFRTELMRKMLPTKDWPEDVRDKCDHFIKGFWTLAENRNLLMHSSMIASTQKATTLYKTTKQGNTELCRVSLPELQRVADDMMTYFNYGLHLSNMINFELLGIKPREGDFAYFAWPDKPPLPILLEYSSDPLPGW